MCGCLVGVVTRLAGGGSAAGVASGSDDGTGSAAKFYNPRCIAVSTSGTVYVADSSNHLIRVISPTGKVVVFLLLINGCCTLFMLAYIYFDLLV